MTNRQFRLEHWLCTLSTIFITSYIILALIPSAYVAEGIYEGDVVERISLDTRFLIFALTAAYRAISIFKNGLKLQLIDAANLSVFCYASHWW